jgi:outer membrane protein, multidrug efflux system
MKALMHSTAIAAAAALMLSACAGWGPAAAPSVAVSKSAAGQFVNGPSGASNGTSSITSSSTAEPIAQFWQLFNDPALNTLVDLALKQNTDLRVAVARVNEARALAAGTDGLGRPTLGVGAGVSRSRTGDGSRTSTPNSNNANNFNAGLQGSWELDLFGRVSNEQRAARALVLSSQAQQRAVQVSVAAEVARTYFELRGVQEQLRVASAALQTQTAALKIVEARLSVGRGTALDTERAKALVAATAAAVPALDAVRVRTLLRLATLTGVTPQALPPGLTEAQPLPALPATALAQIGNPQSLLQRRPDVAAAEQQLLATQAQWGVAQSALFPKLTLAGNLGLNAGRLANVLEPSAFVFNLGASMLWTLIDSGQRHAQVGAAAARIDAAQATFDKAVLGALEDTESALATYSRSQLQTDSLFTAATAASRAAQIARARFSVGASDFFAVLDAERELLAAQDRLAVAQTQAATSLVSVYRALAGGWGG